ncbi:MAG: hypothetical protein LIP28_09950, partial [Deltaproteobacteria bacterium]|nr:hypothetical protein [Deltaproteobacteria bacterium]
RQGNNPELGYARQVSDAVFGAPLDIWLKEPFATPKGAVIAMPVETIPLQDDEWERIAPRAMDVILNAKKSQVMNAFVAELHKTAAISVTDTGIFTQ